MALSKIVIDGIGEVKVFRRKGLKHIRISIAADGHVRLSIPWYVPKAAGIGYLHSKKDWIKKHQKTNFTGWNDGQVLTKKYILRLHSSDRKKMSVKVTDSILHLHVPEHQPKDKKQQLIGKYIKEFLKDQSQKELIPLLNSAAKTHGFKVKKVLIKNLRSRWGSCNQHKVITLNLSLIHLPDRLAEYVIFHELTHTKHLNHSKKFWEEVESVLPDYKERRKALKEFNPAIIL